MGARARAGLLGVGILGAGKIGRMHAGLLERQVAGATVRALYDADPDTAREVAQGLGIGPAGGGEELLGCPEGDAGGICTPTGTHGDPIVAAAQAGKGIFFV